MPTTPCWGHGSPLRPLSSHGTEGSTAIRVLAQGLLETPHLCKDSWSSCTGLSQVSLGLCALCWPMASVLKAADMPTLTLCPLRCPPGLLACFSAFWHRKLEQFFLFWNSLGFLRPVPISEQLVIFLQRTRCRPSSELDTRPQSMANLFGSLARQTHVSTSPSELGHRPRLRTKPSPPLVFVVHTYKNMTFLVLTLVFLCSSHITIIH